MKGRSNETHLSVVAAGIGGTAIAGFGLSLGRDIYQGIKPNLKSPITLLMLGICSLAMPVIGGIVLTQGYRRGWMATIFLTVGLSALLIATGLGILLLPVMLIGETSGNLSAQYFSVTVVTTVVLVMIGVLIGLSRRRGRLRKFAIIEHNEAFLTNNGFKETAGSDVTHYDPQGNALRFLEPGARRLVFMAVGRRGRRAYINLDESGRMLAYSGIV